jgi:hypothetical protein
MFGPMSDIDCDPATQTLYGVTGGGNGHLVTINPTVPPPAGPETFVGWSGFPVVNSLEWVGSTLYGTVVFNPGGQPSSLITINPATGMGTMIGPNDPAGLGIGPLGALAYDPFNQVMYGSETFGGGRLVTVNLATGAATVVGPTGFFNVTALEFDPVTGILYGGLGAADAAAPGAIITINTANGAGTMVGLSGFPGISGLTFCHGAAQGFDVPSDLDWVTLEEQPPGDPGPGPNWVVADDFQSDGRPITCLRWWGSYIDPAYEPDTDPSIDGWLVSFHTDLPADENPNGPFSQPLDLLGLYFLPAGAIAMERTGVIGADGHEVWEYYAEFQDSCLIHSYIDPRDGSLPAGWDWFAEVEDFIYWIDIEAVVGHTMEFVDCPDCACDFNGDGACDLTDLAILAACVGMPPGPGCPDLNCDGVIDQGDIDAWNCLANGNPPAQCCGQVCVTVPTNNTAQAHFWGWHTSPDAWQDEATEGQVVMGPLGEWIYIGWLPVPPQYGLERVDMAFELLTPRCPADIVPNNVIDVDDLTEVILNWGPCPPQPARCPADVDCNGAVDVDDLLAVILGWGPCP